MGSINANSVTVLETLQRLESDFAAMAIAFENGEFALWVGAGISRNAPSLGSIIGRAIDYLRTKTIDPPTRAKYQPALMAALKLANVNLVDVEGHLGESFSSWPDRVKIESALWDKYSKLLDIRIDGEPADYLLWTAVDIRGAFAHPAPPACEHLCIAVLVLEGAINEIASANWDGFIEAAVDRLGGIGGNLQVIVDPNHLRDAPAKARLLKFHGCIVHATLNPTIYRPFLIARETQIINWPHDHAVGAIRTEVISAATKLKALMTGLSLQDGNLQSVFAIARGAIPWPWPCSPNAQGHVFCENEIGDGQRTMLKTVYADKYNNHIEDIESSAHLQSWPEQVLLSLVLKLITDKLSVLMGFSLVGTPIAAEADQLKASLLRLRDVAAAGADGDRTAFANKAITIWSRMISLFRQGSVSTTDNYEVINGAPVGHLASDQNARAAGFGELGVALALLEHGQNMNLWKLQPPTSADLSAGAISSVSAWVGATTRPIFFAHSAAVALDLERQGAFADDNTVVIHADDAWHQMREVGVATARSPTRAPGRTGRIKTCHVSIANMLNSEADVAALRKRFIAEVTL